jgi:bifunctional DNA-binding transcriptional regulator/antitoxin component of YhaV-PrlF toxin-antitoxin module
MSDLIERVANVTTKGQVTIPVDVRKVLGLTVEGGPVVFVVDSGVVTVRSAKKVTLDELLAGFDPEKHRYTAEERFWDDPPVGTEIW